ncbi:unnamed protein product [Rotaria sp. Silwood1]|nr:unnamed protein product [Rotaria sp. Silwood1]
MPNLRQFIITMMNSSLISLSWNHLLNGQNWQQLLTNHVPHLDVFNLLLTVIIDPLSLLLDMDNIIHSFDFFSTKYDDWHVAIGQSKYNVHHRLHIVYLHTLRFSIKPPYMYSESQQIILDTFNMHTTAINDAQ